MNNYNKKRILIFSTSYFPLVGGAEVAVKEITNRSESTHFDLITARFSKNNAEEEKIGNVNIYRVGLGLKVVDKFLLPFLGYFKAKKLHKKNKYDTAWSIMASQASIAASWYKKKYNYVNLVLTLQEGDEEDHLKRYVFGIDLLYILLIKPLAFLVYKKADKVTVISNYLKKRAIRNGVEESNIFTIPNGVDMRNFSTIDNKFSVIDFKNKLKLKESDRIVIHTGRLNYKNAVSDIIRAMQFLPSDVIFINVGGGEEKLKLEKIAHDLKISNRIKYIDFLPHKEMVKYLVSSDVFVRPSLSEGLGNSFLEAMAVEVPVIATPVGGIPDFLEESVTGWFCEVKNPESIAKKIKYILDDTNKEEVKRVKSNALKMVKEKYNWDSIAENMIKVLV